MFDPQPTVTFHKECTEGVSRVLAAHPWNGSVVLIAQETPFHPRDFQWPDHPADRGTVTVSRRTYDVRDAVTVAVSPEGRLCVDAEIPVKKNDPDWQFCVGHVLDGDAAAAAGDEVVLRVDAGYRDLLSRTHSATHLMALAMDRAFAPLWRKQPDRADALGNPDFDQIAMDVSNIGAGECHDRYHMGKSLRKKGFSGATLKECLSQMEEEVNRQVRAWLEAGSEIRLTSPDDALTSMRKWNAVVEGTPVAVACGGTHAHSFAHIGPFAVRFEMPDDETLLVTTTLQG